MYTRVCNAGVSRPGRVFSRPVLERMTTCGVQTAPQQYASTTAAYEVTERLLADETYHIEFNGYLSNHAKHAVIGLYGLDASPKAIQKYWDMYTHEVPYGWTLTPAHAHSGQPIDAAGLQPVLGQKTLYPELVEFFNSEVKQLGEGKVLEKYAPVLVPGMAAALTHGIIHLGWALDFGNRCMLIEGLAYMAYTFVSVHPERFQYSALYESLPVDSLIEAARSYEDKNVSKSILDIKTLPKYSLEAGWHPELYEAGFQWHLSKVLEEGHEIFLKLPQWLDTLSVDEALQGMYKAVTVLYLVSAGEPEERKMGNFVVLHLITSLWGAQQVLCKLPEEQQRLVLKCFWSSMNAIVATTEAGFPPVATLQAAWDKYQDAVDVADMYDGAGSSTGDGVKLQNDNWQDVEGVQKWEQIVQRAWKEDEEHNIKLVYVCRELWRCYGHWRGFRAAASAFTPTPSIGPNFTGGFSA